MLDFINYSYKARDILTRLKAFMSEHVYPAEKVSALHMMYVSSAVGLSHDIVAGRKCMSMCRSQRTCGPFLLSLKS